MDKMREILMSHDLWSPILTLEWLECRLTKGMHVPRVSLGKT